MGGACGGLPPERFASVTLFQTHCRRVCCGPRSAEEETEAERMEVVGQGHPDVRGHTGACAHTSRPAPLLTTEGTLPSLHPPWEDLNPGFAT